MRSLGRFLPLGRDALCSHGWRQIRYYSSWFPGWEQAPCRRSRLCGCTGVRG
jgi:hypothetical protein